MNRSRLFGRVAGAALAGVLVNMAGAAGAAAAEKMASAVEAVRAEATRPPLAPTGRPLPLITQMAQAVEAVHEAGYVHRDICSRNYICSKDRARLKLIDFGLTVPDRKEFQQPGNRTGTPQYMAPEIVRRRPTDARVDIFALGVTMYQTLSGQHPWPGADVTGKAALAHDTVDPIPLLDAAPDVAPELAEVVMRCLSVDPAGRPESAKALVSRLRRIRQERV